MKTSHKFICLLAALVIMTLMVYLVFGRSDQGSGSGSVSSQASFTLPKKIKYSVEVSNPLNVVKDDVEVLVSIPSSTNLQKIDRIEASEEYKIVTDDLGNENLSFTLTQLTPYESRLVDISIWMMMSEAPTTASIANKSEFLKSDKYVNSEHPDIIKLAEDLKSNSDLNTAQQTLAWVNSNLAYAGFIKEDRGALYALENKSGDCTEYMNLYSALLRANDIPTKNIGGFIVPSNKKLKAAEYHNWVEAYLDGSWRVVDPQNNVFMQNESHYVAMRTIDNSVKSSFENSQQLIIARGADVALR